MHHGTEVQRLIGQEVERLRSRSSLSRSAESALYVTTRVVVRSSRIVLGLILGLVALWLGSIANEVLDKPFAALTIRDLAGLFFYSICAAALGVAALVVAFGEGPSSASGDDQALHRKAEANVLRRLQREKLEAAQTEAAQKRVAHWYRYGKWVGVLFDPTIAKRHRWVPLLALVVGLALMLAMVAGSMALRR